MNPHKKHDEDMRPSAWAFVSLILVNLVFMETIYLQVRETKKLLKQDLDACGFTTNAVPECNDCREWAKSDPKP